jgi:hypothetical protein
MQETRSTARGRSAECIRQGEGLAPGVGLCQRIAECNSAIQSTTLRYIGAQDDCAVPRFQDLRIGYRSKHRAPFCGSGVLREGSENSTRGARSPQPLIYWMGLFVAVAFVASPAFGAPRANSHAITATSDFFVSPRGNDAWSGKLAEPGSNDGPFATIARARDVVRSLLKAQK